MKVQKINEKKKKKKEEICLYVCAWSSMTSSPLNDPQGSIRTRTIIIIIITTSTTFGVANWTIEKPWVVSHLQLEVPNQ